MPDTQVNSQGSDQIVENRQQDAGQLHGNGQEPQNLNAMNPQAQAPQAQAQRIQEMLPRRQDPQAQAPQMQALYGQGLQPQYSYAQPMYNYAQQPMYNYAQQPMYNYAQQPMYNYAQQPMYNYAQQPMYNYAQQPMYSYAQQPQYGVVPNPQAQAPQVQNPQAQAPQAEAPQALNPQAQAPQALNPQERDALERAVYNQAKQERAGENEEIRKALEKEGYDPKEFEETYMNWPRGGGQMLTPDLFGRFISDRNRVKAMLNDLDRLSEKSMKNGRPELGAAMRGAFAEHLEGLNQPGDHLETIKAMHKSIQEFEQSYNLPGSPFIPEASQMLGCVGSLMMALNNHIVYLESEAEREQARADGGITDEDEPAEVWTGDPVSTGKILETLNNPVTVRAMLQDLRRISDDSVRRGQGEVAPDVRKSFEKLLNALENGGNGSHMAEVRELYANVKQFQVDRNSGKAGDSVHVALVSSSLLKMRTSLDKNRLELAPGREAEAPQAQAQQAEAPQAEAPQAEAPQAPQESKIHELLPRERPQAPQAQAQQMQVPQMQALYGQGLQPQYSYAQQPMYNYAQQPMYNYAQQPMYNFAQQPMYNYAQQPMYNFAQQPMYSYAQPMYNYAQQPMYNFAQQPMYNFAQQPMYSYAQPMYNYAQQPMYNFAQQPMYGVVPNPQAGVLAPQMQNPQAEVQAPQVQNQQAPQEQQMQAPQALNPQEQAAQAAALEQALDQANQARAGENEEISKALIKEGYNPKDFLEDYRNWPAGAGGLYNLELMGRFLSDRTRVNAMLNDLNRLSENSMKKRGPELGAEMRGAFAKHLEGLNQPGDHLETIKAMHKGIQEFKKSYYVLSVSNARSPFIIEAGQMNASVSPFMVMLDNYIQSAELDAERELAGADGGINDDDLPAEVWTGDPVSTGKILETLNNPVTVRAMLQDLRRISDDSVRRGQGEVAPDVRKSFEKLLNALENGGNGSHMAEVRELYANVKQFQVDRNSGKAGDSVHVALVSSSLLKMRTSLDKNRLELEARAAQEQDADKAEEQVNEARSEEAEVDAADHAEDDLDDWFEAADDAVNAAENNADDQVHSDSIDPQNSEASVRQNQDNALSAGADGNSVSGQENQGYNFSSDIYVNTDSAQESQGYNFSSDIYVNTDSAQESQGYNFSSDIYVNTDSAQENQGYNFSSDVYVNTDSAQESQGYNFSSDIYVNTDSGSQDQNAPQSGQADSNASDYMQDQLYMMPNAAPYGEIQGDELDQFVAGLPQDNSAEQLSGREKENSGKLRISLEELQNGSEHKRQSKVMKNGKAEKGKEIHQHNSEKGFSPFSK